MIQQARTDPYFPLSHLVQHKISRKGNLSIAINLNKLLLANQIISAKSETEHI